MLLRSSPVTALLRIIDTDNTDTGTNTLLLARLMSQYCFADWRLSSVVVVVCNAAGVRPAGRRTRGNAAWERCRRSGRPNRRARGRCRRAGAGGRARGRSGGPHCTAGQYGYVPLGRHLVRIKQQTCEIIFILRNRMSHGVNIFCLQTVT